LYITVNPLIEAWSQLQAGSLIEAGWFNSDVLIKAGSPIEAGVSNVSQVIQLKPSSPPYDDTITDVIASAISE